MTEAPLVEKLVGCRAKLDRAARQIAVLDHAGRSFGRRRPFRVERRAPEPGELRFVVAGLRPPPAELAVHAGEIVHDLHSALDHLVWAVAEHPWRRTQFPIFLEAETWAGNSEPNVRSIPAAYVAIVEDAQPFHARQPPAHPLALLNHLWNADKHRLLETTFAIVEPGGLDLAGGPVLEASFHVGPLHEGTELARARVAAESGEQDVELEGEPALGIAFHDTSRRGRPLHGAPVTRVLQEIHAAVAGVYERFLAV